tara:strand:+ start:149 stop:376 length:228 start_codon:yes stop_codon:yes gene_type:complete
MTIQDFINEFSNIFVDTDISSLKPSTSYLDLDDWDSLTALETIAHFDEEFNLIIEPEILYNSNSFEDLYNSVLKK